MTVLSVARKAALSLGIDQPDVLMTSTDREVVELASVCTDAAQMIANDHDWQTLQSIYTITGDGTSEAFALPSDYLRMSETGRMWSSRWIWAIEKVPTTDIWLEHIAVPYSYISGEWIIYGDEFHFLPTLGASETIKFFYVSDRIVNRAAGGDGVEFMLDDDTFKLDERLLTLAVVWRWKMEKGLPFDAHKALYDDLFMKLATRDSGGRSVIGGPRISWRGSKVAFPQTVGGV